MRVWPYLSLVPGRARTAQQNFFLQRYLTQAEWDVLQSQNATAMSRLNIICNRKDMLGDVYGTEFSDVHAIALIELAARDSQIQTITFSPKDTLAKLKQYKDMQKLNKKRIEKSSAERRTHNHYGQVLIFPSDPDELKRVHPEIYTYAYPGAPENPTAMPVASKVNECLLQRLRDQMPARVTHNTVAASATVCTLPSFVPEPPCPTAKFQGTCANVFWLLEPLKMSTGREDRAGGVVMPSLKHAYGNYWDGGSALRSYLLLPDMGCVWPGVKKHVCTYKCVYIHVYMEGESVYIYIYTYIYIYPDPLGCPYYNFTLRAPLRVLSFQRPSDSSTEHEPNGRAPASNPPKCHDSRDYADDGGFPGFLPKGPRRGLTYL